MVLSRVGSWGSLTSVISCIYLCFCSSTLVACADLDHEAHGTGAPRASIAKLSSPGLTLGYSFDEGGGSTASDVVNAVQGSLSRDSLWGAGKFGQGLVLDGVNAFVDAGAAAVVKTTGSISVSAWAKSSGEPADDATIVSIRSANETGFQLDTSVDSGARTVSFKLTDSSGQNMYRYGATTLAPDTWYFLAGVYDADAATLHVYVNGQLDDGPLAGAVSATQVTSTENLEIGRRPGMSGFDFVGSVDEVRIYTRALSAAEIQADLAVGVQDGGAASPTMPTMPTAPTMPKFQNEILATGFTLPTCVKFLPDGRMLLVELAGKIKVLDPPYTQPDPQLFLQLANVGSAGVQQGIYDLILDPDFNNNRYYYIFYTAGTPNHDRLSRFKANAMLTGTEDGSERVLYEDMATANAEHHGGAVTFGPDGMIYFTTGEAFNPPAAQDMTDPRGKLHRIRSDGSVPQDNPFNDGNGSNIDSIWALGLRNPYRAYYDIPSNRMFIGDVGGNDNDTAIEELNIATRGGNYGWPECEGSKCGSKMPVGPFYTWKHDGRDACITGGFVYHGKQFPAEYAGSYFFADYTQNWIRRMTFDANGGVDKIINFMPDDGSLDGPWGDIVYLTEGPDGALYYVDLGYSDVGATFGTSKVRRVRWVSPEQGPTAMASAEPIAGQVPLTVQFSSAGSSDPGGVALTYAWNFGDGGKATEASPVHVYERAGRFTVRLTVSNGVGSTLAAPIIITAGDPPVATVTAPNDGLMFVAGDTIAFSGTGMNTNGPLPVTTTGTYKWNIDFLHGGHVHPYLEMKDVTEGTFTIPDVGHDYSGDTRYRIQLTVTDQAGLATASSVIVWPTKVNLTFQSDPPGMTLYLDGIAKTAPFVHDSVPKFMHQVEARNAILGAYAYKFKSWSDSGDQTHTFRVSPDGGTYTAVFTSSDEPAPTGIMGSWNFNEGEGEQAMNAVGTDMTVQLGDGASWDPNGKYGAALSFDDGSATIADASDLDVISSFTLTAWVNPKRFDGYQTVLMKEDSKGSSGSCGYWIQSNGTVLSAGFNGDGECVEHSVPAQLPLGRWSHLAAVYDDDANTFSLFLDGELLDVQPETAKPITNDAPLTLGRSMFGDTWAGLIDEVHVYKRALSSSEIDSDMNMPR